MGNLEIVDFGWGDGLGEDFLDLLQHEKDPFPAGDGSGSEVKVVVLVIAVHAALGLAFLRNKQSFSGGNEHVHGGAGVRVCGVVLLGPWSSSAAWRWVSVGVGIGRTDAVPTITPVNANEDSLDRL